MRGTVLFVPPHTGGPMDVSVYTAGGRLIRKLNLKLQSIDLGGGLTGGVYMVCAEANGLRMVKKMLVH
jgi:hypothetical protein